MKVLAFDASTARGSVAVMDGGTIVFSEAFDSPRGRGGELFPALERAMRAAAGEFDRVVVGIGPGSYNGLRAAIAAAEAFHFARGWPRVGVVSVRALPVAEREFFALGDARGARLWMARVRDGAIADGFELLPVAEVLARLEREPNLPRIATSALPGIPGVRVATPDAGRLARLGAEEPAAGTEIEPLYLKPAHITTPRARGFLDKRSD